MKRIGWLVCTMVLVGLSGCEKEQVVEQQAEVSRPVPMMRVGAAEIISNLRFPGRVRAAQRADLAFNVPGLVLELPVEEGQLVEKGDLVARLDDENYRIQLRSAQAQLNKERTDFGRMERLWKSSQAVAKTEVDKQRTAMDVAQADYSLAKKDFDDTRLVAPFTGVVTKRHVENFSNVQNKEPIVSLQDLEHLEIVISVPERVVRNTPKQLTGFAVFADRPELLLPVTLKSFSSESDSQTQSYEVVMALEPGYQVAVLPGMSVEIVPNKELQGQSIGNIKVPLSAVFSNSKNITGVWVFNPETSRVAWRAVELGEVFGADVLVLNGLADGEQVVTAGVSQLRETMLVRPL